MIAPPPAWHETRTNSVVSFNFLGFTDAEGPFTVRRQTCVEGGKLG